MKNMKYLNTMVRIENIEKLPFLLHSTRIKRNKRKESKEGKYTLIFLGLKNSSNETGLQS